MPNQFLSDEFGDIEDYFVTDYWLIDNFVGDQMFTWGKNGGGQLGININGEVGNKSTPVTTFAGGTNWKQVSGGYSYGAAVKTDGTLWVWGASGRALGINDASAVRRSTPVTTFAGGTNWKQVSCGDSTVAAVKTDGTLWVWGDNASGVALGINTNDQLGAAPITPFGGGTTWKQVSVGGNHTAAIKTDGSLWVWGRGDNGQLGTNNTTNRGTPVTTFAGGNDWKQVSCAGDHTAAIKTDGSLWTWGAGGNGRLGTNDTNTRTTPVTTFAGGNTWKSVDCGTFSTAAIKTDGSLWVWGVGLVLGTNDNITRSIPVTTFAGGTNWKSVSAGRNNTTSIKTDGTLWTWGAGNEGRLGDNRVVGSLIPITTFAGGNNWKQVSTGNDFMAAIKSGLNVDLS